MLVTGIKLAAKTTRLVSWSGLIYISFSCFCSASGASVVAIDNKIEQAMVRKNNAQIHTKELACKTHYDKTVVNISLHSFSLHQLPLITVFTCFDLNFLRIWSFVVIPKTCLNVCLSFNFN